MAQFTDAYMRRSAWMSFKHIFSRSSIPVTYLSVMYMYKNIRDIHIVHYRTVPTKMHLFITWIEPIPATIELLFA